MSFKETLLQEKPLQIIGVINAYVAIMAKQVGYKALYLSGAGIANSSFGLPDLGMTSLDNVAEEVRRIRGAVDLPLLVDIDTGWGNSLMIARSVKTLEAAGASAVHLEDQPQAKRCGHRSGKEVVSTQTMVERIHAAVDAKKSSSFLVMARTDALAVEGLDKTIERAQAYAKAGADMIFLEAITELSQYVECKKVIEIPLLINLTEFGKTPLYSSQELKEANVDMILYPLSINRVMNFAALHALKTIREEGAQTSIVSAMQTRDELYRLLNYEYFEALLNKNGNF